MKNILHLATLIFMFGFLNPIIAQNPVSWEFKTEKIDDSTAYLIMKATIAEGWIVYGSIPQTEAVDDGVPTIMIGGGNYENRCNPNLGPVCLEINYDVNTARLLGITIASQAAITEFDSRFQGQVFYYKDKIELRQKFKYVPNQTLKGHVYFMTCNSEKCMPPKYVDFNIEFPK